MKRRLFTILSAVSLLLFVAVVVMWVRSYLVGERLARESYVIVDGESRGRWTTVTSAAGRLWWTHRWSATDDVEYAADVARLFPGGRAEIWYMTVKPPTLSAPQQDGWRYQFLGFDVGRRTDSPSQRFGRNPQTYYWQREVWVVIPYPFLAVMAGIIPAARIASALRRRARTKRRPGLCPACGYDLRATPRRCPECGREAAAGAVESGA